jgi:succinoglycan biosynthesis protein ExoL
LDLAKSEPTLVRIELRGRATGELQKLIDGHLPLPNMQWGGPFDQSELEEMYSGCHFTWAIDYFQSGQNSLWLLPHRLYDGCIYRRPALALEGTQTAVWLLDRSAGVVFSDPVTQLSGFFKTLGSAQYKHLHAAVARVPFDDLAWTLEGCRRLTEEIVDSGKIQPLASPPNPG